MMDIALPLSKVEEHAKRVEALGYDGIAVPDLVHDGLMAAALAVRATSRLHVATSALVAFPRSPMVVAVAAWDLQEVSGGRFRLGLGPQVRGNIRDRFSTEWSPPAPRMREYVQSLRAIFDCFQHETPLHFEGEHYRFTRMQAFTRPPPIEHPDIPIQLAGIGPHMTALAGELADGLVTHPTNATPRYVREAIRPHLERGAARTQRDPDRVTIVHNPLCATGETLADVARERERHRLLLATLYSTPAYWPTLVLHGWEEIGERANDQVRKGDWKELAPLVTDEMLDVLVPSAPLAELPSLLIDWYSDLGGAITFPIPSDPALDAEAARGIATLRGAG